jgi:hypothetical protein
VLHEASSLYFPSHPATAENVSIIATIAQAGESIRECAAAAHATQNHTHGGHPMPVAHGSQRRFTRSRSGTVLRSSVMRRVSRLQHVLRPGSAKVAWSDDAERHPGRRGASDAAGRAP